jgi:hypothetical protein
MTHRLTITVHPELYAICRLAANEEVPVWAAGTTFLTISRTPVELSIVCTEKNVPLAAHAERKRRLMQIEGTLAFTLAGVLASVAGPLAQAEISIFAVSTYDTDYVLVSDSDLERAIAELEAAGHAVRRIGQS